MKARERLGMTRAEVSAEAARIAKLFGNSQCWISESWLSRVEGNKGTLSGVKLMTLLYLYRMEAKDFLDADDTIVDPVDRQWRHHLSPERHMLVESGPLEEFLDQLLPDEYVEPPEETKILDNDAQFSSKRYVRAIIGRKDNRMYPILRPGAVVLIDRQRRDINKRIKINHETDTPIFFFETHDAPICGWAYRGRNGTVDIMAHPIANMAPLNMRFEQEAQLVGQAVAVLMWFVEEKA